MLTIDNEHCIQCGECIAECYKNSLSVDENNKVVFDATGCNWCGHCLAVCPRDCIVIDGDGYDCMDVEDLGYASKPTATQVRNMIMIRRSVRRFTDTEVTEDELSRILEAARYAPTGMNKQDNTFIVVSDPAKRDQLTKDTAAAFEKPDFRQSSGISEEYAQMLKERSADLIEKGRDTFFFKAPVVIYIFSNNPINAGFAAANMCYMAQALQLGVCLAGVPARAFFDEEMRQKWNAPERKKCVISLLIGNPEPEYFSSVPRKTPDVIKFYSFERKK